MDIGFKEIVIGILVLLVLLFYGVKSKYMLSNKVAAKNLEAFLKANYGTDLKYTDLYRFFNTATMNPNCFKAVINKVENPKVEMYLTFDASEIATQKDVKSMYPDGLSFHEEYIQKQEVVASQAIISDKMKPLGVSLDWDYELVTLTFDKSYAEAEVLEKEHYFIDLFSKEDTDKFGYYHSFKLELNFLDNAFPNLIHYVAQEDGVWLLKDIKLKEDAANFNETRDAIKVKIEHYLAKLDSKLMLHNYYSTFVNKADFSRVIYVEYTQNKRTAKEVKEAEKGVYVSPINGYVVVYWNLDKKLAQHINFVPISDHLTLEEILENEVTNLI